MTRRGRWVQLLLDALAETPAAGVRATMQSYLSRPPTRAEMNAVRRAAYQLVEEGAAVAAHSRVAPEGLHAADYLVLVRPGVDLDGEALRLTAIGRITVPGALEERRQASKSGATETLDAVRQAAVLSRAVDAELLKPNEATLAERQLGAALEELGSLRRRLRRRASAPS